MSDKGFFFRKVMQTMWDRAEIRFHDCETAKHSATVEEERATAGAAIAHDQVTDETPAAAVLQRGFASQGTAVMRWQPIVGERAYPARW